MPKRAREPPPAAQHVRFDSTVTGFPTTFDAIKTMYAENRELKKLAARLMSSGGRGATAVAGATAADDDVESDEGEEEYCSDAESDDDVDEDSNVESDDDVGSDDARRARLRREWRETKDAIMGTPATWGINPRTKQLYRTQPNRLPAAKEATVRDYEAHAQEMDTAFGKGLRKRFTFWNPERKCFVTTLCKIPGLKRTERIYSHSWADALKAHAAATACADAHHSLVTIRAAKRQRVAANASKRAKNCATYSDNSALERRELVRLRDVVAKGGKLRVLICPDGCWADALVRTEKMPKGQWLAWQHKSTHKLICDKEGKEYWQFRNVKNYADAIVVCTVEAERDRVWVVRGQVLAKGTSKNMRVTKSKVTEDALPLPADGKTLPMRSEDVARVLEAECAKVVARDATALPTITVEKAEAVGLGKTHAVERAGVLAWMQCLHGGAVPWIEMPDELQADARNVRLMRDGTVIAYPDGQNTKTDLEVIRPDGTKTTHQFKTARSQPGQSGFQVNLETNGGNDGRQIKTNTYRLGDNDFYTVVRPDTTAAGARAGHVDVWTIPEAELATPQHGLLCKAEDAMAEVGGFYVYRRNEGKPYKHGWTRDYHRAFVKGADGVWRV